MSVNKLAAIFLSGFLVFAFAPAAGAQSTSPTQDQPVKKQSTTQHQATTSQDEVRKVQQALKDKGMYTGAVDGTLNAETKKALRDFQQKNNLKTTGTLNHETLTALGIGTESSAVPAGKTQSTETKKSETTGQTTSKSGTTTTAPKRQKSGEAKPTSSNSRSDVREIQIALKNEGFYLGPTDGIMGPVTKTALRNYQAHNHLEVTGTITGETRNSLSATSSGTSTAGVTRNKPEALSNSDDVRQVQKELKDLMYNPGDANGMMTAQTRQAIREFQFLNNLQVTGNLDEQTKQAIDAQATGGYSSGKISESYGVGREKPGITEQQSQNRTTSQSTTTNSDVKKSEKSEKHKEKADSAKVDDKDAPKRITKAAAVLHDLTGTPDKKIPNELLERAEAIAVIPDLVKGAFGVGGRFGKGLVSDRLNNNTWSAPSMIKIGGGSFGAQIGVSSTDLVLVFTDRKALDLLEGGKDLKLGVDAGVVAGPVGRTAEAGVNANLSSGIYAYSRSKGLFAGIALDGAVLSIDKNANEKTYGKAVDAKDILNGKVAKNAAVRPFTNALDTTVPKKRIS